MTDRPRASSAEQEGLHAWLAIRDCGTARNAAALPQLLSLLELPEVYFPEREALRRIAAWALAQLGFDVVASCAHAVDSSNPLLREGYADALGETRDPRAVALLEPLALDSDRRVSLWACLSLAKCGESSVPAIHRCLANDPTFSQAANLVDALAKIGSRRAMQLLSTYLGASPWEPELQYMVRCRHAEALAAFRSDC